MTAGETAMGFADLAAGAMSQLYRLMAEAADRQHQSQFFAKIGGGVAELANGYKAVARFLARRRGGVRDAVATARGLRGWGLQAP